MRLEFIWIGKTKDANIARLEGKYLERIGRTFPVDIVVVPEQRRRDKHQQQRAEERETRSLERRLGTGKFLVVLDEKGKQPSSLDLADWLKEWREQGTGTVAFVVGGHAGVPPGIKTRAQRTLSLSKMTLAHEIARIVLLEQVYRAVMILEGSPYHRSADTMEVS